MQSVLLMYNVKCRMYNVGKICFAKNTENSKL